MNLCPDMRPSSFDESSPRGRVGSERGVAVQRPAAADQAVAAAQQVASRQGRHGPHPQPGPLACQPVCSQGPRSHTQDFANSSTRQAGSPEGVWWGLLVASCLVCIVC